MICFTSVNNTMEDVTVRLQGIVSVRLWRSAGQRRSEPHAAFEAKRSSHSGNRNNHAPLQGVQSRVRPQLLHPGR